MSSPHGAPPLPDGGGGMVLRVGTWNMSGWGAAKVQTCWPEIPVDVLAVQETHLAVLPLQWAHTAMRATGGHLHHGHPVKTSAHKTFGRSCGVAFMARQGLALAPALPVGAAWRWLHLMSRLHAVQLPPRPGLPRGLLLLSVYAPLQVRQQKVERDKFTAALQEVTHALDMQVPTLLMGDFNGSVCPVRDFQGESAGRREACPLLAHLLGPGGAWVDVHVALLEDPLSWTFHLVDQEGKLSASRIDLILANHAALGLVSKAWVQTTLRDGGHSPVGVDLNIAGPTTIIWQQPHPRPPPLLSLSCAELQQSTEWLSLLQLWEASSVTQEAISCDRPHSARSLSRALAASLQLLVEMAGGWVTRPVQRRAAYDSSASRQLRRRLIDLHVLEELTRPSMVLAMGCWPRRVERLSAKLRSQGLALPSGNLTELRNTVVAIMHATKAQLAQLGRDMRRARHTRWRDHLPSLWRDRPGVIHHWLQAPMAAWGTFPVLNEAGGQCLTAAAVDQAVQGYWVTQVLRQHAGVDEQERWDAFERSPFGSHVPRLTWAHRPWPGPTVQTSLAAMGEGTAPGLPGVPIAVWKALPASWMASVARLLNLVEEEGAWPPEWLEAYVVMIPKASGGLRPRDQRPITVLPVLYRLWSKGVALEWAATLQRSYLGQAALGFRAQAGTLHVAQLLSDIIALQRRRKAELWLMSFDIEKCYDSIPWWALFGVMRKTGMAEQVVRTFESYYHGLRRRFRYGQVAGEPWQAANSLMQGCPAAPDQLNLLLEPFHRWALEQGLGVEVAGRRVPSVSFADDVTLVGRDRQEAEVLIAAYLQWCSLLGLRVTKVQLWSNTGREQQLQVGAMQVCTVPQFKVVGVVLGEDEVAATAAHFTPRLRSALATLQRLRALELPSSIGSLLWQTDVLPRALYGCEVRNVTPEKLQPLSAGGKAALGPKFPMRLNEWRAPEVLMGPPFGESRVRDPVLDMRHRQLQWLALLCNMPGLVGEVHRAVAWPGPRWDEPNHALRAALKAVQWTVRRNPQCLRARGWPVVLPEGSYSGEVLLHPVDDFPMPGAVFTDGSVATEGGAAAILPDEEQAHAVRVLMPRSSTHCELVALLLALDMQPPQILTDSLAAMLLLQNWGSWPPQRTLQSLDRVEVRHFLHRVTALSPLPQLVKVKAHDERAIEMGHPRAVGNDQADALAKRAATTGGCPLWTPPGGLYHDPVEILDAAGRPILAVRPALEEAWWARRQRSRARARPWLERLYPQGVPIDWSSSTGAFRRPVVSGSTFVHPVPPAVIKWLARVRAGCLASRARLVGHGLCSGSPQCLCCGAEVEDDEHVLAGCPATGTQDWPALMAEAWAMAARTVGAQIPMPPASTWMPDYLMLMAALIPMSSSRMWGLPPRIAPQFLAALHRSLAAAMAECLRRREELIALALATEGREEDRRPDRPGQLPPCSLPGERQLSAVDLRELDRSRRRAAGLPVSPEEAGSSNAPAAGEPRRKWLRQRLVTLIQDDMLVCPFSEGVPAVVVLELFERLVGEAFSETPGTLVGSRVRSMAKVLGNVAREEGLQPPLLSVTKRSLVYWNRQPKVPGAVEAWRRSVEAAEAHSRPVPRLREQMAAADAGLMAWVKEHRYLVPSAVESGESGMALLLLWEVDHGQPYPSQGGQGLSGALQAFSKRLQDRIVQDAEVSQWLTWRDMSTPLCAGLAPSHHRRWSLRLVAPAAHEPQGWYDEFVGRWRAYLETQARPPGPALGQVSMEQAARIRPGLLRDRSPEPMEVISERLTGACRARITDPTEEAAARPQKRPRPSAAGAAITSRKRPRPVEEEDEAPLPRRQTTLMAWLQPPHQDASSARHGRAVEGPPT